MYNTEALQGCEGFLLVGSRYFKGNLIADESVAKCIVLTWTHMAINWHQLRLMCLMAAQLLRTGLG